MKKFFNIPWIDWAWLCGLALWRLIIASRHGLGVDEAHYVLYGLRLDWSYFDHPPLVGWVQSFFFLLLGQKEWVARLPAVLAGLISSVLLYRWLGTESSQEIRSSRVAILALNSSFLVAALWIMFLPDTLLFLLAIWLLHILSRLLNREKKADWVELGFCLGFCGLTKYTAVFFVFSILGILYTEKAWSKVKPWGVVVTGFIGAFMVSPVFYWNFKHNWVSFSYQQSHVMGSTHLSGIKLGVFLLTQILAYSPFLIIPLFWFFLKGEVKLNQKARIASWLAVPTLLFFLYTSLKDEVLPHWTLIGWGLMIPVGFSVYAEKLNRLRWAVGASFFILLFAMSELTFQFMKFPPFESPYADLMGWEELHGEVSRILKGEKDSHFSIGVSNWTLGSRANYYLSDLAPVFVLDNRFDQFDLWEAKQKKSPRILVLSWRGFPLGETEVKKCQDRIPVTTKTFSVNGAAVNAVDIFWCRNFQW